VLGAIASEEPAGFGALLKQHRLRAGLSQEELAERAGLSARAIGALEQRGRHVPHRDTIRRLARALGLDSGDRARLEAAVERRRGPRAGETALSMSARPTLPIPPTPLIGRKQEVADVCSLLRRPDVRLVTLTGPGGVGKTRLGLEVARRAAGEYADGVRLVELAPLADPALAPLAVLAAIGVREAPGRAARATLLDALRPRRTLLLLDNCEHLVDACAQLAHAILETCPGGRLLCTSRESLRIAGEVTWRVPPLAAPPFERVPPWSSWRATPRCGSSRRGPRRRCPPSSSAPRMPRAWRGCAPGWTASPWPWSWRRRACGRWRWRNSPRAWTSGSGS